MTAAAERRFPFPGLLAGLVLLDVLVNLPGLATARPLITLLAPSIDLLVLVAACLGVSQAGEGARAPLRIVVAAAAVLLFGWKAAARFGADVPSHLLGPGTAALGWAFAAVALCAAGAAAWALCGLLVKGFTSALSRNVAFLVIAAAAVTQVLTGRHLFTASIVPRMVHDIGTLMGL